ncbi:MAG TPA: antibiotic biosynthesis monooxygenase [Planctomycetaceae bacterium]|nr:antibiotic biosynthesis monooxygenase [Planctomycetaceae bacterium]HIQ21595.1 antibiotic biosynthesis monooxygenase [Planctomycetota bacterium]
MIQATLRIVAPRRKRDEILRAFRLFAGPTRVERGCIRCHLYVDAEEEHAISYVEQWETEDDLVRHLRSDRYRNLVALIDVSIEPPEVRFETISRSVGLEYLAAVWGISQY